MSHIITNKLKNNCLSDTKKLSSVVNGHDLNFVSV